MSLNLAVCRRCCDIIRRGEQEYEFSEGSEDMILERGWLSCPAISAKDNDSQPTFIKDPPPPNCEYKLEHAVSEIVNIDKKAGGDE